MALPAKANYGNSLGLLRKNIIIDAKDVTQELKLGLAHKTKLCRYVLLNDEAYLEVLLNDQYYKDVFLLGGEELDAFKSCLTKCDTVSDIRLANYEFNKFVVDYVQNHTDNPYRTVGSHNTYFETLLINKGKRVIKRDYYTQVFDKSYSDYASNTDGTKTFTYDSDENDGVYNVDVTQSDTAAFKEADNLYELVRGSWTDFSDKVKYKRFELKLEGSRICGVIGIDEGYLLFNYNSKWRDNILKWVKNSEWEKIEKIVIKEEINNPIPSTKLYDWNDNLIGNYREWLQSHQANHNQMFNLVSDTEEAESSPEGSEEQKSEENSTGLGRLLGGLLIFYFIYKIITHKETKEEKKKRKAREKREREEYDRQYRENERRKAEEYEYYSKQQKEQRWD